ncbi:hypothetical protein IFR05_006093 [Cadophora sp. M221]|nr:hypothetical protein IFR05_006093 [Cadophora sp. M221]
MPGESAIESKSLNAKVTKIAAPNETPSKPRVLKASLIVLPTPVAAPIISSTTRTVEQPTAIALLTPALAPICAVPTNVAGPSISDNGGISLPKPSENPFSRIILAANYDKAALSPEPAPDFEPLVKYTHTISTANKSFMGDKNTIERNVTSRTTAGATTSKAATTKAISTKSVPAKAVTTKAITTKAATTKAITKNTMTKKAATTKTITNKAVPNKAVPISAITDKAVTRKTVTDAQAVSKSRAAATSSRTAKKMEETSFRVGGASTVAGSAKLVELSGATLERAAPADHSGTERVAKKLKSQSGLKALEKTITLYLNANASGSSASSRCIVLTEAQIFKNSGVLKYVLQSKADSNTNYNSDDELCYDPSTSKDPSKFDTRSVFLRPLLAAMLSDLDEELDSLDVYDKKARDYIESLSLTPSDKLWVLVTAWQSWVKTGSLGLGRCPFQRERMLKFARVMEMPVEFFRIVKKHEPDVMHKPDEKEHEMWKACLHPEQLADKEERETAKYYSHVAGHKWDYYKERGQ